MNSSGSSFSLDQLNPGVSEIGYIAFGIPPGLKNLKLKVDGSYPISFSYVDFSQPNLQSEDT